MSSTKMSPDWPTPPAWTISWTASGIVMKKRVISGSVTVTGPPSRIWRRNVGITEPDEPSTLPKRTAMKRVPGRSCASASTTYSQSALEAPIAVSEMTALSVETSTKRSTPASAASSARARVARTLLRSALNGLISISGTCL